MSHQFSDQPSVKDEAAKIIQTMDGRINSPWLIDNPEYDTQRALQVRAMLIKDSQTFTPAQMKELIKTVSEGEDKKRGYDLKIYGRSNEEINDMEKKIDKAREILGKEMKDATASKRLDAFKDFNQTHALELANYTSEMVLVLTHHSGPGEYGEKGRTPGATIEVAAYHMVNGLPDFNLVESKNTIDK